METPKNVFTSTADMMRKYQDMIVENQEEVEEAKEEDTEKEEVEEAKEEDTDDDKE